ncbi:MFS transporter [Anaeroselena agilis]|uniref:MFS transporter n=1 Tax=Anaeroselena agilis TaxID=3063788 RepID=A0ABU3NY40_9FIRM|nr:MFS transporter [Selenomonadales bacterium 4137-cl]
MNKEFRLTSRNFVCVCIATFLYFGSFYLLIPTLPQYVDSLGGSPGQIGLVMGAFSFAAVLVRPYLGRLADRRGRKRLMLLGTGFFALLFPIYGFLQSVAPLYLLRIAHGFAHAAFLAASAAYIADLAPPQRRGEVIGIYGTANVVSMALFPAVGINIIQYTQNFDVLFACSAIAAAGAFLAVVAVDEIGAHDGGKNPVSLLAVGRRRVVVVPSLALFAGAAAYGTVIAFLPVFAPQRGLADFGVFFTVYAAGTLASRIFAGKLSDRWGRRRVVLPFMALLAVGVFLLPFLDSLFLLILIGLAFGFGFGAFMPTLNALVVDKTPPAERGSALGFFTSFMDMGIAAGAVLLGQVGEKAGFGAMFATAGFILVAGILVFALYTEKDDPHTEAGH